MSARIAKTPGGGVADFDSDTGEAIALSRRRARQDQPSATRRCCSSCCCRPPARARARGLPFSLQRRATDGIERGFLAVLVATLALHVAVVVYLRQVEWPRRPPIEEVPDRFVSHLVRMPRPAPPARATTTVRRDRTRATIAAAAGHVPHTRRQRCQPRRPTATATTTATSSRRRCGTAPSSS
jgi:hypothetical protein